MMDSLIGIVVSFAVGILGAPLIRCDSWVLWTAASAITLLSLFCLRFSRRFLVGLVIAVGLMGALRYQTAQLPWASLYARAGTLREVSGTVISYPQSGKKKTTFTLQPDHLVGRIRVTCFWDEGAGMSIHYGDRLHLTGKGQAPKRLADFDYRAYLARQRIFATMAINGKQGIEVIGRGGSRLVRAGDFLRRRLLATLDRLLPPAEAGLAHSLLFGERGALSPEIEDAFRDTGLMHLLAVSGLHLGVFLAGLWFAIRLFGLRPLIAYPLVGIAVLLILWIVGPRVSLVRAGLLFAFLALGSVLADLGLILRRWINPYCGLAGAALVILVIRPMALGDVGFQLSFAATAAILILFHPALGATNWIEQQARHLALPTRCVRYPLGLLAVSIAAQAGTAPFLAYHFHAFYPYVLLANLLAIPLATIALWLGLLTLLFSSTVLVTPLAAGVTAVLHGLIDLVEGLGRLPGSLLPVSAGIGVWIGGLVIYLFLLAVYLRNSSS